MEYNIEYSSEAAIHIGLLPTYQRRLVMDRVEEQLTYEATVETRNRKPMRENPVALWELRIGNLRVYYDVSEDNAWVTIRAVGVKVHNRVFVAGKEIEL
jgi:mRNA-degrading endonuclease RelE of RelBE toxin-antitoxin system